jgi:hypothetical protein
MKLTQKDENLYYNIARTLHDKGDFDKGLLFADKALALRPAFEEAKQLRRVLEKKIGQGA